MIRFGSFVRSLKFFDVFLLVSSLLVVLFSVWYAYETATGGGKLRLIIESSQGSWVYDMSMDVTVAVAGTEGVTTVVIRDGKAFITDSPCTNKTCIAVHPIERANEWIACLPNTVFIRIDGAMKENEVDIIGY